MKAKKILIFILSMTILLGLSQTVALAQDSKQIYLYGEIHGVKKILDKEFELWNNYYHQQDMRHLFIELPYYTAEYLNIWMKSNNDQILDEIYADWQGTQVQVPEVKEFYKKIKKQCPKTVFHGTDVGHQHDTTGKRFLEYLKPELFIDFS